MWWRYKIGRAELPSGNSAIVLFGLVFELLIIRKSSANEIDGFRLGMPIAKVRQVAAEKGYSFSNPISSSERWVSYVLMKNGPSLSFCDTTLSAVSLQRPSSFHEITNTLKDWKAAYGEPEITADPRYVEGTQFSTIKFQWLGSDNIRRDITMSQFGQTQINLAFGYSYIMHSCRSDSSRKPYCFLMAADLKPQQAAIAEFPICRKASGRQRPSRQIPECQIALSPKRRD